jgi:hypothetical protein
MLCLLVLPALAQEEWVEVEISVTKPSSVLVVPGGKPDKVRLYGRGFELVKEVQVHRNSSRVKSLQGKLRMVSQGIADLEVTATPEAEVGTDYTLVFFTPTHSYPMSLEVEVSDPNE